MVTNVQPSAKLSAVATSMAAKILKRTLDQKDGYVVSKERLDRVRGELSDDLLKVAQASWKESGNSGPQAVALFEGACRSAESYLKHEAPKKPDGKDQSVKVICPSWPVIKSQMLRALKSRSNEGSYVSPAEYKTAADFFQAATEARATLPRQPRGAEGVFVVGMNDALASAIAQLRDTLQGIPQENHTKAATLVHSIQAKLNKLIPEETKSEAAKVRAENKARAEAAHGQQAAA